jgi:peroxiredoxin
MMLDVNQTAPDFTLPQLDGGSIHFYDATAGDAVLIFYKFTCGTSRFTLPFLEKIHQAYGTSFFFAAIAQDEAGPTTKFRTELDITMPFLLDTDPYPVSRSYGLHTVPSIFLINKNRKIVLSSYGFVKQEILNLADLIAEKTGQQQIEPFDSVEVPEIKPG